MIARALLPLLLASAASLHAQQGVPRSVQVVRVQVPESLRSAAIVGYSAYALDGFTLIGRGSGSLQLSRSSNALLTVAIPATALAGTRPAARVLFLAGGREAAVTVDMTVLPVHSLHIEAPVQVPPLRPGERFFIPYKIENRGNTPDTVTLRLETPTLWRSVDTVRVVVPANASVMQPRRLEVPRSGGTGNFFVRAHARSANAQANVLTTLSVGPDFDAMRPTGASARFSVGTVNVDGHMEAVPQLALTGPLTSSIQVDGRLTIAPELSAPLVRGLATVGTFVTDPHFVAWTPKWRGTLGSTVLAMTELTGVNAGGRGASWAYRDTARAFEVVAAGSGSNVSGADGALYGAHLERNLRHLRVGATATHLQGIGFQEAQLTSYSVQARSYPIRTLTFGGETAYRQFLAGNGIGWSAHVSHNRNRDHAELQVTHAPGGTSAFARAENEVHFSFNTAVSKRLDVSGSALDSRDESRADYPFHARSFAISPSWLFSPFLRGRADVRHTSFDVAATPIGYGNAETHFSIGAGGMWRGFAYSSDVGLAQLERSVRTEDIDAVDTGTRFTWSANASRNTRFGAFIVETNYERNSPGTGYLAQQVVIDLRADRVQIPSISSRLEFDAELSVQSWTGVQTKPIFRAGAQYVLPQTTLALGLERNPILSGIGQRTPWIVAFRAERSLGLPRIITGGASGVVYRDYNGNGRRDPTEPGVPNVAVRRGSSRAITQPDGSYRFVQEAHGNVSVDPTTLPFGSIVGENNNRDIGLVGTTRLLVTLELATAERLRNIDISNVAVIARDGQGREWVARRTSSEQAMFEALPVGRYTITANFAAVSEPLRVEKEMMIDVQEGDLAQVKLQIAGRPLRFRTSQ